MRPPQRQDLAAAHAGEQANDHLYIKRLAAKALHHIARLDAGQDGDFLTLNFRRLFDRATLRTTRSGVRPPSMPLIAVDARGGS